MRWLLLLCLYERACTVAMVTEDQCRAMLTIRAEAVCVGPSGLVLKPERKD